MVEQFFIAWLTAVVWSIMIRNVLNYPAKHPLNWGGALVVICVLMAMLQLFSVKS